MVGPRTFVTLLASVVALSSALEARPRQAAAPGGPSGADPSAIRVLHGTGQSVEQEAYLKASNTDERDRFGSEVACSGPWLVVSAPREDSAATTVDGDQLDDRVEQAGAVYVFLRSASGWTQDAYLKPGTVRPFGRFGAAVDVSGATVVVGRPGPGGASVGSAHVFERLAGAWVETAVLESASGWWNDEFGLAVSISGDTIAVGAAGQAAAAGAVHVFTRTGGAWTLQAELTASNADGGDAFGRSVAVSGDTLIVGAPGEDSPATGIDGSQGNDPYIAETGAAYVFARSGSSWTQTAYVKASNTGALDSFGTWVDLDGDTAVVGAPGEDSSSSGVDGDQGDSSASQSTGAAYVFRRRGGVWGQAAYLKASDPDAYDLFGERVAVSGDVVVIGACFEDSAATGVDGDDGDDSAGEAGAAYAFVREGAAWSQVAYLKASNTRFNDRFAQAIAVSGDRVAAGAPLEDGRATGVDGFDGDDSARNAGAAYVFDLDRPIGERYCSPAVANSTGEPGVLTIRGSTVVAEDDLRLMATDLPTAPNVGYFVMGQGTSVFTPPGAAGPLCITPGLLRYLPRPENTLELGGGFEREVGTSGPISGQIAPGSTWNFQAWYRDGSGPSNLTDAVSVAFR